ncbi:MAG: flagellar motor protein MotB [Verrucomicrobia bacterium]|nr:flagellar motor protein MotB [Verrucomicrobiota bacterium]
MKSSFRLFSTLGSLGVAATLFAGCSAPGTSYTNPNHPGPALGQAVGTGVGAVAGNVAGAVVGVAEGATSAAKKPFTNEARVVRTWRTETTSDGRTIQVPVDTVVDEYGRPIASNTTQSPK